MGRHNNSYTAAFKLKVVDFAYKNGKRSAARQFNVHEKCVRNWCMQREKLSATNGSRRAFRGKKSQYPTVENKIIEYICNMRKDDHKVTREMCQHLAVRIAEKEGIPLNQFKASEGWFRRMINRHVSSFDLLAPKRQKELAAQRAAGLISDEVSDMPNLEDIPNSVPQSTSAITMQGVSQNNNVAELVTSEFQDNNYSEISVTSTVESSSTLQSSLNNVPFTLPLDTSTDTSSSISQKTVTSVLEDQHAFPLVTSAVVSSTTTQVGRNKESLTQSLSNSAKTYSSTVPHNINSSQISLSSAVVKDTLPVTKNGVENSSTAVSNNDPCILPSVSSTETYTLPIVSSSVQGYNTRRANNKLSTLPAASVTAKDAVPTPQVSHTRRSIATQINIDELKFPRTGKKMYPSKKRSTGVNPISTKPLPKPITIKGRRIIDFGCFLKKLKWANKHSKFGCNLNNMFITKEKKVGICASYVLKCVVCDFQTLIWSDNPKKKNNLNSDFVSGMLSINCNFDAMNKLLSAMCLPNLTQSDFIKERDKISSNKIDGEKTYENTSKVIMRKTPEVTMQQNVSSASDTSCLLEQVDPNDLFVEDQFEIKEETANENESEVALPDQTRIFDDKLVDQEQATLNMAIIKQENDLNLNDDEFTCCITDKIETSNKANFTNNQSNVASSPLKEVRAYENVNKGQIALDMTIIKEEIDSDLDNEELTCCNEIETSNKESFTKNKDQPNVVSSQVKEVRACENGNVIQEKEAFNRIISNKIQMPNTDYLAEKNRQSKITLSQQKGVSMCESQVVTVTNQEQINLYKNVVNQHTETNNRLVESEINDMEITDNETNLAKSKFSGEETSVNKKIKLCYKGKFGSITNNPQASFSLDDKNILHTAKLTCSANAQGSSTTVSSKEKNIFQSRFASSVTATSSAAANGENIAAPSITSGMANNYFIPMQPISISNENGALIVPQVSHNVANGTFQGAQRAVFIPQTPTLVQQNTSQPNGGLLPLIAMHQSWTNNFTPIISNPSITVPGVSGTVYMPGPSSSIQESTGSSNIAVNADGITCVSLVPAANQQPSNLASVRPPLNANVPRWIGRANIHDSNPFCTLPGGGPIGVSNPVSPKSNSDQAKNHSKRPRFRCDDCDINFPKYESLDSHKKSYCVKRLKLLPSSTATSHTLIDNPSQPTCVISSFKAYVEELLSAMAIKRSFLETSMKTAIDAQYIINLHKSAQDLTQKTFKELDVALKREKALMPEASLEEQHIISEARNQALIRAEAAYKQEKHSAAAVEQALYRQKAAIEASLTATGHEQTALVSTLRSLKEQVNQSGMSSTFQTQYDNICDVTVFNQNRLLDTSLARTTEQQKVANSTSSESVFDHKASSSKSAFFIEQRSEVGATSQGNILQNVMQFDVHSEKLNSFNLEENKAIILNILPNDSSQPKEIEEALSNSSSNAASFQNYQKKLSPDYFHLQRDLNSNVATSAETSPVEYKNENMHHECFNPQETSMHHADTQYEQAKDMMNISAKSSSDNFHTLTYDILQKNLTCDFPFENKKLDDSSYTLTKEDSQSPISLSMIQSKPSCTDYS